MCIRDSRRSGGEEAAVRQLLDPAMILALRETISATFMDQKVVDYIVDLVRAIAATPGIKDLAMTTNGILLDKLARPLAEALARRLAPR